jgi:hypothetical protein
MEGFFFRAFLLVVADIIVFVSGPQPRGVPIVGIIARLRSQYRAGFLRDWKCDRQGLRGGE